jgi:uncharacterized membrane protein
MNRFPWLWLIVGTIGFMVFGGWKGFFGAILGVMLLPLALITLLLLVVFVLWFFFRKNVVRVSMGQNPFEELRRRQEAASRRAPEGTVVEAEATVVRTSPAEVLPPGETD